MDVGLLRFITNTTDEESDAKSRTFQASWTLLHLLALVNCIAVILHILSITYHAKRIGVKKENADKSL
jgi:hypothetical protein